MSSLIGRAVQACPHCHGDILLEIIAEHLALGEDGRCYVDVTYTPDSRTAFDHHHARKCLP